MQIKIISFLIIVGAVFTIACQKTVKVSCEISEISRIGIDHFQPLVYAMEKYKTDNGNYPPKDISLLIPKYIDKIPLIPYSKDGIDENKFNTLRNERIESGSATVDENGRSFSITFYPKDERICLLGGRNNICEYTSDKKQWGCYQH